MITVVHLPDGYNISGVPGVCPEIEAMYAVGELPPRYPPPAMRVHAVLAIDPWEISFRLKNKTTHKNRYIWVKRYDIRPWPRFNGRCSFYPKIKPNRRAKK